MVRREREEEKGERGHHVTCVISVKKLDNCPRLHLVNLPTFRLGVLFPRPGNIINGRISCSIPTKKMNNAAPVPIASEMRDVMKSMRRCTFQ
ncbi:uncharacterized protein TNCV_1415731 [Trichonephila clavipes]|nr:uncharacterized protein TNCV_1415731 [Trichonephila clavipes]